jgi:hypothetical protein
MNFEAISHFVWPLTLLLLALVVLHQVREELRPITRSMVGALSQAAARNATQYAIALAFGLSASLAAFVDVFSELGVADLSALSWHQYAALWAKVMNPFVVATLAYATQSNFKPSNGATSVPFQPRPPSP